MSEQTTTTAETPKKKSNTLVIALVAVIVLGGAGFGAWRFLPKKGAAAAEEPEEATSKKHSKKKRAVKSVMHLESFVVNLNGEGETGYLRIGIDLGLEEEEAGGEEAKKKGAGPTPIIRDTVLTVLAKSTSAELLTVEGKEKLKKDLLEALEERVPDVGVLEVYFTEFIVQR
jgi:flagellar FliL protein